MAHKFFISHFIGDKIIAELFSTALKRITLEQITPWYSSDSAGNSGLKPGDIWFNQILERIKKSKAVVTLLTPNSINKPWIYFESGIGQALEHCTVIPICIGVKRDGILPPLGLYQCYQLNDYRSVVEFFSKLLALFQIKFDEEMARVVIEKFISDISNIPFDKKVESKEQIQSIENLLENLKGHIDKRFIEVLEKPKYLIKGNNVKSNPEKTPNHTFKRDYTETSYSVLFYINFPEFKSTTYLDISEYDSFQDITDTLYFMLSKYITVYSYMEQWIILEKASRKKVIIREISTQIPAKYVFEQNSIWEIIKLEHPYNSTESKKKNKIW
jgi:hypothetical protein